MSKLEITRLKNGSGAKLMARIATGTAHASAFGHFRISRTATATIHPSHALRVNVSSSARCVISDADDEHYTAHAVDPEHEENERCRQQQAGQRHHMRGLAGDAMLEIVMAVTCKYCTSP